MLKELTGKITHPAFRRRKHVALLVETSLESGRDILRGIARYAREEQRWVLFHEPRSLEESIPQWLRKWDGDGVIARVQNAGIAEAIREAGIHAVDVLGVVSNTGIPLVHVDDREIARMASEHLVERGFNYFGYFGINDENWSVRRKEFFENHLSELGYKVMMFETPRHRKKSDSWEQYRNRIIDWIMRLPKPVGVMVCSDQRGMDLLEACRQAGVAVPDEVAVIGVDNDEVLCEIAYPPLSSIWPAHNQVGYEAAALLERLMNGESRPSRPILISPSGVVTRRSTDVLAVEDRNIAKALRMIREHACDGLSVDEVVQYSGLSRSVLQRRFRKTLGKTIHSEIVNVRLKRACQLIAHTDIPLSEVSEKAGFKHQEYMGLVFRKALGKTPAQYCREVGRMRQRHFRDQRP